MPRYLVSPALAASGQKEITIGNQRHQGTSDTADRVLIGRLNEAGSLKNVYLDVSLPTLIAFFGKKGSGKSYSMGALAEGLCTRSAQTDLGQCTRRSAVLLLDTLNIFATTANPLITPEDRQRFPEEHKRLQNWRITPTELDVIVFMPAGYRTAATPQAYLDFSIPENELQVDDLLHIMDLAYESTMGQLTVEIWLKASEHSQGATILRALDLIDSDPDISSHYGEATRRAVRQRLRAIQRSPVFSEQGTPLDELLHAGRLSILQLGAVEEGIRTILSSVLLRRIHRERLRVSNLEREVALNTRLSAAELRRLETELLNAIPPTWVMIDEAQNIFPADRQIKSTEAVVRFVREGRNFGLSFALTTQQPSAVDQRILAQADTVVCHKLTVQLDIVRTRDNLKCAEPLEVRLADRVLDLGDWLRSLSPGQAIVTNTDVERVFALEVRPRICPHGGGPYPVSRSSVSET